MWSFSFDLNSSNDSDMLFMYSGKLFQVSGPATAKLLAPQLVFVAGTIICPFDPDPIVHYVYFKNSLHFRIRL